MNAAERAELKIESAAFWLAEESSVSDAIAVLNKVIGRLQRSSSAGCDDWDRSGGGR